MKITVVVPVHNSERYLEKCLNSLMEQTYTDIEILCIDDYSTDSTVDIINKYIERDSRAVLVEDENGSYGHKINLGFSRAAGDYVCILESDDYYARDMIESMVAIINIYEPDYVDGDYTHFANIGTTEHRTRVFKYDFPDMYNYLMLGDENLRPLYYTTAAIWTGAYNKKFLDRNSIFLNESAGASYQDVGFRFLVGCLARKSYHIGKSIYYYRIDNASSSVNDQSKIFNIVDEYKYLYLQLTKRNILNDEVNKLYYTWKYVSFLWNLKRLSYDSALLFWNVMAQELKADYKFIESIRKTGREEFIEIFELTKNPVAFLNKVRLEKQMLIEEEKKEYTLALMTQNHDVVIFGAGRCGGDLYLQLKEEKDNIRYFCDNDSSKWDTLLHGVQVCSLEKAIDDFPDATYIISGNRHFGDIKRQLILSGISDNRINGCSEI